MDKDEKGYSKINIRQINDDSIEKCCTYKLPKGVRLKDFLVNKDENSKKFCIIGIGGGGINIVESISKDNSKFQPMYVHIDYDDLNKRSVTNKLYLMSDIEDREILTVSNRKAISEFVSAHSRVYVVTTFGMETHRSEAVEKIVQHLYRLGRKVTLIVVKPFLFEVVPGRIRSINETVKKLEAYTEKIFVFHNEDLLTLKESSTLPMSKIFSYLDNIIFSIISEEHDYGDEVVTNIYLNESLHK